MKKLFQWLNKVWNIGMGSATNAVTHPFKNNEPPKIGEQPYKDKPKMNRKWR
tara:strand:+ start:82 stop:237 length:156 start_codon:yes stop_codon:yes gene_type:complete